MLVAPGTPDGEVTVVTVCDEVGVVTATGELVVVETAGGGGGGEETT